MKLTYGLYTFVLLIILADLLYINVKSDNKEVRLIFNSCQLKMENNGCGLTNSTIEIDKTVEQIYFAGFGYLSTNNYYRLKEANTSMCKLIKKECHNDMNSEICRFAKKIYLN